MKLVRSGVAAFVAVILIACSPAPSEEGKLPAEAAPEAARQAEQSQIVSALTTVLAADLGMPISLRVDTVRTQGDWAWVVALPQTPDGGALDFSQTRYAEQAREGVLDGGGTTYALLESQPGGWEVTAFVVGPTDVAYGEWPAQYGVSPELLGLPADAQ